MEEDDASLTAVAMRHHRELMHKYGGSPVPSPISSEEDTDNGPHSVDFLDVGGEQSEPNVPIEDFVAMVQREQQILAQAEAASNVSSEVVAPTALERRSSGRRALPPFTECSDKSFACARWKELDYCKNPLYNRYMHFNCEVTCETCACQITAPPPPSTPVPVPTCEGLAAGTGCCKLTSECQSMYPALNNDQNLIRCVSNAPVDQETGWPVDYQMMNIGGMGYDPEFHPYWQVKHIDIANWRDSYHTNSFPVPRRGHMMAVQGEGNTSTFWMFGGFGTIPTQMSPVDVWQDIGVCTASGGLKRKSLCDSDGDGQYRDMCLLGAKCNIKTEPKGGCGQQGECGQLDQTMITMEYLNDIWSYDMHSMIWTRYWAQSTRPTHRAFHSMVMIDDLITVYGGLGPFCYEYCKDAWTLNLTTAQWQSDIYKRGGVGTGVGDGVQTNERGEVTLSGKTRPRPLSWSYGSAEDVQWRLHAYTGGYRWEEDPDIKYRLPERRFHHIGIGYKELGHWVLFNQSLMSPNPCRDYDKPIYNTTTEYLTVAPFEMVTTIKVANYTEFQCNYTDSKYIWIPPIRWMFIYAGYGGAKKTDDITVQKQTYYLDDMWKYDMNAMLWVKLEPYYRDGVSPGMRRGHAACLYKDTIYMFGGRRAFAPEPFADYIYDVNKLVMNDLWGYDIKNITWFIAASVGAEHPHERHGTKMGLWDDIIYLFGGYYDPVEYLKDTWHYNITSQIWRQKRIDGLYPTERYQYAFGFWYKKAVIFGGYGSTCSWVETGSPGHYCQPDGPAFFLGDTWHYTQEICANGCMRNGTCHYGSCVCGPGSFGEDCSNFTCPDCTTMDPSAIDPAQRDMPCEIWDYDDNPVVLRKNPPYIAGVPPWYLKAYTEAHHDTGAGIQVYLSNNSILDGNCWYDYGNQEKVCRSCSLRGQCDYPTGNCICDPMYSNFDCSYMACPHPLCNGGGSCLLSGKCVCRYAVFELDCSISFECPNECSYQGICQPGGTCRCYDGFFGSDCAIEISFSSASRAAFSAIAFQVVMALITMVVAWGSN